MVLTIPGWLFKSAVYRIQVSSCKLYLKIWLNSADNAVVQRQSITGAVYVPIEYTDWYPILTQCKFENFP